MRRLIQVVGKLPQFVRDADSIGLSEDQRALIIAGIASDPLKGDEIRGSGCGRKVRFAGRGKGKSGGYRVVTAYFGADAPVYLVAMLSKGERSNFGAAEIVGFKKLTDEIARYWQRRKRKNEEGR